MALHSRWPFFFEDPEQLFRSFVAATAPRGAGVFPPVNLFDDGERFMVRVEIPGVNKDTLELTAQGDQLTIRGERKIESADAEASYHRRECDAGSFRRAVTLPQPVDGEAIKATYVNGVLEVVLPRAPEARPRRITVN